MHRFLRNSALIFSAGAIALTPSALRAGDDGGKFKIVKKIPLEGGGRWDYVTVDPEAHRVYIARATHVTVLDSASGAVVGDIPDTPGVHGVAVAPDLGIGFISQGGAAKVAVFDLKTLKVETQIATGENPDSILYHPATHQVFVQNGKSKSTSVIDAKTKKVVATIPLESKPEFFAYDEKGNVFINLEDKHAIAVIDASSKKLKATWVMEGCEGPSGLAIDNKTHTLFSSCDGKLMVVDSNSGKVRQSVAIGDDCDGVFVFHMVDVHGGTNCFAVCADWLTRRQGTKVRCTDGADVWSARIFQPTRTERMGFTGQGGQSLRRLRAQDDA